MKRNAHIAIINTPVASVLNPMLPIVLVLMRRGHRVTFATSGPFATRLEQLGVEVIEYRHGVMSGRGQDKESYCRLAINTIAGVRSYYRQDRPDVVMYDFVSFAGPILAHQWQVPRIRISPLAAFSRATLERQLPNSHQRGIALASSERIDHFLREHGTPSNDYLFQREKLNIHTLPRDFDPCGHLADDSCLYAGRCSGEQIAFGDWRPPDRSNRPIVLVAASKSHVPSLDYFKLCIAALKDLPWHVVLSIDDDNNPAELQPLPDNFAIVQRTSHTRILPHASLMIFSGGSASSCEAAYHGVPLVMISQGIYELEAWSENMIRLGIGLHLKGTEVGAQQIRAAALEAIESTAILHNVQRLQHTVRREPGAEECANHIEEFVAAEVYRLTTAASVSSTMIQSQAGGNSGR